jgi:hypothetical protein
MPIAQGQCHAGGGTIQRGKLYFVYILQGEAAAVTSVPADASDEQPFRVQPDTPPENPGLSQTARGFEQQKRLHDEKRQVEGKGRGAPRL